jgi:hypothetical protein
MIALLSTQSFLDMLAGDAAMEGWRKTTPPALRRAQLGFDRASNQLGKAALSKQADEFKARLEHL